MTGGIPVCCNINEFEKFAISALGEDVADYYQGGATSESTLNNNRKAYENLKLRPRVMRDVSNRDSSLTVLGKTYRSPVGISPTAMQKLAHCEGEIATARAAGAMDAIMILSLMSTVSLEEVRAHNPSTTLWMQMYIFKERDITLDMIRRAEKAGFSAIVLTMDTAVFGSRYRDIKNQFAMPPYLSLGNFRHMEQHHVDLKCLTGISDYINTQFDDSVNWNDVSWLVKSTKLPVICKGILTGEDANLCLEVGAQGIIVSNHGGRQLDQTPATIEALPEVVQAVGDSIEVYIDGGIRYGTDVFKAVGLGAKYVFIGRASLWGLAHSGSNGVAKVLQILHFEFDQTLALCGCTCADDITREMIVHRTYYEDILKKYLSSKSTRRKSAKSQSKVHLAVLRVSKSPEKHRSKTRKLRK
ncbi:hypothetical protein WDU94_011562 [Cyamophila willieti]